MENLLGCGVCLMENISMPKPMTLLGKKWSVEMEDNEVEIILGLANYVHKDFLVPVRPQSSEVPWIFSYKGRFVFMYMKTIEELSSEELLSMVWLQKSGAIGGCVQTLADAICLLDEVDKEMRG